MYIRLDFGILVVPKKMNQVKDQRTYSWFEPSRLEHATFFSGLGNTEEKQCSTRNLMKNLVGYK